VAKGGDEGMQRIQESKKEHFPYKQNLRLTAILHICSVNLCCYLKLNIIAEEHSLCKQTIAT
jgi:hypothetical protein